MSIKLIRALESGRLKPEKPLSTNTFAHKVNTRKRRLLPAVPSFFLSFRNGVFSFREIPPTDCLPRRGRGYEVPDSARG